MIQKNCPKSKSNTKSCELCEYITADTDKNSDNSLFIHYVNDHFQAKIDNEIKPHLTSKYPFDCNEPDCNFDINDMKCNWVQDISKAEFELLSHYLRKHNILKKYIENALEEKRQKEKRNKECEECGRPKDNTESVCIECLDKFVFRHKVRQDQYKCGVCKKDFPSLSETYQHIDFKHIAIEKSDETTKNVDENVAETKEEPNEETMEEATTESSGKKLCLKKIGSVHHFI